MDGEGPRHSSRLLCSSISESSSMNAIISFSGVLYKHHDQYKTITDPRSVVQSVQSVIHEFKRVVYLVCFLHALSHDRANPVLPAIAWILWKSPRFIRRNELLRAFAKPHKCTWTRSIGNERGRKVDTSLRLYIFYCIAATVHSSKLLDLRIPFLE